tara:strand:+ start:823 stop:1125 length:303 start_codon:yes stop_codon:yes gene_type:complete
LLVVRVLLDVLVVRVVRVVLVMRCTVMVVVVVAALAMMVVALSMVATMVVRLARRTILSTVVEPVPVVVVRDAAAVMRPAEDLLHVKHARQLLIVWLYFR